MSNEQPPIIRPELADELAETAATLTRLGVTLANLPLTLLPEEQRRSVRQMTGEVFRVGAMIPRTVTSMLEDRQSAAPARESLGERMRREQAEQEQVTTSDEA
ncbi:MAG: hypothetical protein KDD73_06620 [Anaerolineales bacterium]|nr:hypothetical protein [Anaerolineales bacterium]MCB9126869.1 hypothetical protein [Ardenticatenales bacterium]MCB9172849.1 hypothetical protein [Ardenticatenales bacterium]